MPAISRRAAGSRETLLGSLEMRAEIAVRGVLHGQAVEHLPVAEQRKGIEDTNRAGMAVEQIAGSSASRSQPSMRLLTLMQTASGTRSDRP